MHTTGDLPSATPPGCQLRIGDPNAVAVSLVFSPQQAVLVLMHGASPGSARPLPEAVARQLSTAYRGAHRVALHSLARIEGNVLLDACAPIAPTADTTVVEQADRLRSMPDQVLTDELSARFEDAPPLVWREPAHEPRRWRYSLAAASLATWTVLEPRWRNASRAIDREVRRVATAATRGATDALLNTLHPRLSFRDGKLRFHNGGDTTQSLAGRRLVLLPMIGAGDTIIASMDRPDLAYIAYPLRTTLKNSQHEDTLGLMMGVARAQTLRSLSRPLTVGALAAELGLGAPTISYHCDHLQRAGLLDRTRDGRWVVVSRTTRGDELVDLLSA